jgi:FtsP/CotA-like multicopper oxidase with cupredoxin domain
MFERTGGVISPGANCSIVAAALLALICVAPAFAEELAPQRYLAPPQLPEKVGAELALPLAPSGCRPDGNVAHNGNMVTLHLVAKMAPNEIRSPGEQKAGKDKVSLRSYGGCLTGPVIELKPGNTLRIFLENALDANDPSCPANARPGPGCFNTINMHFHGLHVSPAGNSDNVLLNIAPETHFEYEVSIPGDHPSGTFWYHPHRHGSTAIQVASGASGALIVRGDRPYVGSTPGDIDAILHDDSGRPMLEKIFLFQQIPYACFNAPGKINQNADSTWKCDASQTGVVDDARDPSVIGGSLSSAAVSARHSRACDYLDDVRGEAGDT